MAKTASSSSPTNLTNFNDKKTRRPLSGAALLFTVPARLSLTETQ